MASCSIDGHFVRSLFTVAFQYSWIDKNDISADFRYRHRNVTHFARWYDRIVGHILRCWLEMRTVDCRYPSRICLCCELAISDTNAGIPLGCKTGSIPN